MNLTSQCDGFPLYERNIGTQNEQEKKIGKIIAENLIDNGATLQMGEQINILNKSGKFEFRKIHNQFCFGLKIEILYIPDIKFA